MRKIVLVAVIIVAIISLRLLTPSKSELGLCGQEKGKVAISLSRTACYGKCPAYDVAIDAEGNVEYKGDVYGPVKGPKKYQVQTESVSKLIAEFQNSKFFELNDKYTGLVTDLPTYTLCFSDGKREKKIVDYAGRMAGMPAVITNLEIRVDEVAKTAQFR